MAEIVSSQYDYKDSTPFLLNLAFESIAGLSDRHWSGNI